MRRAIGAIGFFVLWLTAGLLVGALLQAVATGGGL